MHLLLVKNEKGEVAGSPQEIANVITTHFQKQLAPQKFIENIQKYLPKKMNKPFDAEEIAKAAKSLKNGKSCGVDNIRAEMIKYASPEVHQIIADIYNETAETGEFPQDMVSSMGF